MAHMWGRCAKAIECTVAHARRIPVRWRSISVRPAGTRQTVRGRTVEGSGMPPQNRRTCSRQRSASAEGSASNRVPGRYPGVTEPRITRLIRRTQQAHSMAGVRRNAAVRQAERHRRRKQCMRKSAGRKRARYAAAGSGRVNVERRWRGTKAGSVWAQRVW